MMNSNGVIFVSERIKKCIKQNKPVLALESTIISHGMPYPQNVQTALRCEEIARENGAEPATIAIIGGQCIVGITPDQIEYIGRNCKDIRKASRRDIPFLAVHKLDGATTVSGTIFLAAKAGIKVFATGGIGGVHRDVAQTWDISADLEDLAITDIAVVCSGAKSILDLPKTFEYTETKNVLLIGYKTHQLPAFFTRKSGQDLKYSMDNPNKIASLLKIKSDLGINSAVIIANPIPEEYDKYGEFIEEAINNACKCAKEEGIKGFELTPYLLEKIKNLTQGKSLDANIALVQNNVKLGAQIANGLSDLHFEKGRVK